MSTCKLLSVVAGLALALGACKTEEKKVTDPAAGSAAGSAATKPEPAAGGAGGGAFICKDAPAVEKIPAGPVKGEANLKPFVAKAIYFEPGFKAWRMIVHENALSSPTGLVTGGQSINIDLPEDPAAGKKWTRPMKYGDGYFQIVKPDDPQNTTSWNASNAWAIEITKWEQKPYDPKGSVFQEAGKASGRIAVCYQGGGSFKDSWAAGTFENVPIRYMGKPYWMKEAEKKEEKKEEKK